MKRNVHTLQSTLDNERGTGLVSAMLTLSLLAIFGLVAAQLAVNEKRTSLNEFLRAGAVFAADSGGESAVAWITERNSPPPIVDFATKRIVAENATALGNGSSQNYDFDIAFQQMRPRVGYDLSHVDFVYDVDSEGRAGMNGKSNVGLLVRKLNRSGHQ